MELRPPQPTDQENNFYFEGKYFDNEQDFWQWVLEWSKLDLDQVTAKRYLELFSRDIIMNIFLLGFKFSNVEFKTYLQRIFEYAIKDLHLATKRYKNDSN